MALIRSLVVAMLLMGSLAFPAPNSFGQDSVKAKRKPQASHNDKGPAYTEPPKNDLNFPLMGEFLGKVKTDEGGDELLGLQIRVIGQDHFDANAYFGGLPGQPKFQPTPFPMIGKRSDGFVILSGGPWAIFVEKNVCRVIDRKGKQVGQLKRVRRSSQTLHAVPPENAMVLFDGTHTDNFSPGQMTDDGLLMQGADLKPMFQDFNLHIEFKLPYMPEADEQKRGNSGLYLQSRYECQILDSFATTPVINGCGALYRFRSPDVNMCLPPLVWQTYDVQFTAPRWAADGTKRQNATVTSWINGVKVQDNISLPNKTGAGKTEEPILLPIRIQDHGDPVRFRNAWIVDRGLATGEFPISSSKQQRQAANKAIQQRAKIARKKRAKLEREKKKAADNNDVRGEANEVQDKN